MEQISSVKNTKVKEWNKLKTTRGRKKFGSYLVEGRHPVREALDAGVEYQYILVVDAEEDMDIVKRVDDERLIILSEEVAKQLSDTINTQGVFLVGTISNEDWSLPTNFEGKWLILDDVQDPGNIGTMVRTADAAGYAGVIFGNGTADFYNPKILRSMQGSQYHLILKRANLLRLIPTLIDNGMSIYGSILSKDATAYDKVQGNSNLGLIVGNEGNGMSPELANLTTANLYIPIKGKAESLNVAIAAGVLMFSL